MNNNKLIENYQYKLKKTDILNEDYKVVINKYDNYDNTIIDSINNTNIDNILMPPKIIPKETKKINLYEINIDYSNIIEYDEYNLNILSKYDYLQLKTYSNKYINIKVIEVDNNIGKIK
jgi:hypothetical protein